MNGDVYADVHLTGDLDRVTDAQLAAIDLLASLFADEAGWRVTIEIDPGTVITATPTRQLDALTDDTGAPVRPPGAPLSPQDGSSAAQPGPTAPDGAQAPTEGGH